MSGMFPGSSEERILVEALMGLGTLERLGVRTREELEVHSEIVEPDVWKLLPHPRVPVGVDHVLYVVVCLSLSTK